VRGMRLVVAMFSLLDGILMTLKKSQDSRIQMCAAQSMSHARGRTLDLAKDGQQSLAFYVFLSYPFV